MNDPRVVKPQLPIGIIVSAVLIGLLVLGFIIFAVGYTGYQVQKAKLPGVIISKEFVAEQSREISIGRKGQLDTMNKDGDYYLTVEAMGPDGAKKKYDVWVPKDMYNRLKVGDKFDVGPYLVKE